MKIVVENKHVVVVEHSTQFLCISNNHSAYRILQAYILVPFISSKTFVCNFSTESDVHVSFREPFRSEASLSILQAWLQNMLYHFLRKHNTTSNLPAVATRYRLMTVCAAFDILSYAETFSIDAASSALASIAYKVVPGCLLPCCLS